jgi:hypothetical protein
MFIVLNCNELAGISDFGEKSVQVVPARGWQIPVGQRRKCFGRKRNNPADR